MLQKQETLISMLERVLKSFGGVLRTKQDKYQLLYKENAKYIFALIDRDNLYLRVTEDNSMKQYMQSGKQISLMIEEKKYEFQLIKRSTIIDADHLLQVLTRTFWAVSGKAYDSSVCPSPHNRKFIP